jgi:hypothetical protein
VASEGEDWKKYRKITAPAFSEVCHGLGSSHNADLNTVAREIIN